MYLVNIDDASYVFSSLEEAYEKASEASREYEGKCVTISVYIYIAPKEP